MHFGLYQTGFLLVNDEVPHVGVVTFELLTHAGVFDVREDFLFVLGNEGSGKFISLDLLKLQLVAGQRFTRFSSRLRPAMYLPPISIFLNLSQVIPAPICAGQYHFPTSSFSPYPWASRSSSSIESYSTR